jgi:hypothetical protein
MGPLCKRCSSEHATTVFLATFCTSHACRYADFNDCLDSYKGHAFAALACITIPLAWYRRVRPSCHLCFAPIFSLPI